MCLRRRRIVARAHPVPLWNLGANGLRRRHGSAHLTLLDRSKNAATPHGSVRVMRNTSQNINANAALFRTLGVRPRTASHRRQAEWIGSACAPADPPQNARLPWGMSMGRAGGRPGRSVAMQPESAVRGREKRGSRGAAEEEPGAAGGAKRAAGRRPFRRKGGNQERRPVPRLSRCSATADNPATNASITTKAVPTPTSLTPSTPKRKALTM